MGCFGCGGGSSGHRNSYSPKSSGKSKSMTGSSKSRNRYSGGGGSFGKPSVKMSFGSGKKRY